MSTRAQLESRGWSFELNSRRGRWLGRRGPLSVGGPSLAVVCADAAAAEAAQPKPEPAAPAPSRGFSKAAAERIGWVFRECEADVTGRPVRFWEAQRDRDRETIRVPFAQGFDALIRAVREMEGIPFEPAPDSDELVAA